MSSEAFNAARTQAAEQIRLVVAAGKADRGAMRPPDIDLTSIAARQLKEDDHLGDDRLEAPIASVFGHIERLLIAADDQADCVAELLAKEHPSWFGHLAVLRATVEALSRCWYLADPDLDPVLRATRLLNEQLFELNHASSMLGGPLQGLPEDLRDAALLHVSETRKRLTSWATDRGVSFDGGYLGDGRLRPSYLLAAIYAAEDQPVEGAAALAIWSYSKLSSVAHGLPDGMSRYLVAADGADHAHLVLPVEEIVRSVEPLLTAYDAAIRRCSFLFRWPVSQAFNAEMLAARMYVNRAGGILGGD